MEYPFCQFANEAEDIDLSIIEFGSFSTARMFAYCHKLSGTFNIKNSRNVDFASGQNMFYCINHANGEQFVINYTAETEGSIDTEITNFKNGSSANSTANVIKGSLIA